MEAVDDFMQARAHDDFVETEGDINEATDKYSEAKVLHSLAIIKIHTADEVGDTPLDAASKQGV
jgi:hypothetical protein